MKQDKTVKRTPAWMRFWWDSGRLLIAVPYLWMLVLFLIPFGLVLKISMSEMTIAMPPYFPTISLTDGYQAIKEGLAQLSLENYRWLMGDPLYFNAAMSSLKVAFIATTITLVIGYALAYSIHRAPENIRGILLILVILPFWTSFLIRVYSWISILKFEGLLNQLLLSLSIIDSPLNILYTDVAVYIGIVYSFLPFMILPIYAALEKLDYTLVEAAQDLGCSPFKAFWKIIIPYSMPGIIAGYMLVFIPAVGEFVVPDLLGDSRTLMIGKVLWNEFFANKDWPVAASVSIILLLMLIGPILLFQRIQMKNQQSGG